MAPFVLPLSLCLLLFAFFSRLLAIRSLLLLLVLTLCGSSRSSASSTSFSLAWFERGHSSLSDSLFLFASLLLVASRGFPLSSQSSVALAALLGSVYPVHLSLLALFARPLLPFSLLLGLLFHGPALRSPSQLLGGSLFPILWFLQPPALLLRPALLVAVTSLCFLLCCWSACPAGGSSGLRFLAVCSVYCSSLLVCRAALLFSVVCRLVWLGPPPALA